MEKNVEMIEAGQVASLIVKDASRLGREYLQVATTWRYYLLMRLSWGYATTLLPAALFVLI